MLAAEWDAGGAADAIRDSRWYQERPDRAEWPIAVIRQTWS